MEASRRNELKNCIDHDENAAKTKKNQLGCMDEDQFFKAVTKRCSK
jgi:hypothetical protein